MDRVLVVDDDRVNRALLREMLCDVHADVLEASSGEECLALCRTEDIATILLDVMMPGRDGFSICRELKQDPRTRLIPVLLVTALDNRPARVRGLEAGADDFLTKPVDVAELVARVRSALKTHRAIAQVQAVCSLAGVLAAALEVRDPSTGEHASRVASYALAIGRRMGLGGADARTLYLGALLHDIGKVGVPDAILRKPGSLTFDEFEEIKKHPAAGAGICRGARGLEAVAEIIERHHERWDGDGYPRGLRGTEIPLLARITAVADAYDAMTSNRPYHRGIAPRSAFAELVRCRGTQFDPDVVDAFVALQIDLERGVVLAAVDIADLLAS